MRLKTTGGMEMSVFDQIFNRKKPLQQTRHTPETSVQDMEEEDPEEEGESLDSDTALQDSDPENPEEEKEYEIVEREILPAKIICPDCGGITLEGLEFCDKCGGELQ